VLISIGMRSYVIPQRVGPQIRGVFYWVASEVHIAGAISKRVYPGMGSWVDTAGGESWWLLLAQYCMNGW